MLRREDAVLRLDRGVLVGLLASTEHLTVGTLTVPAGGRRAWSSRTRARSSSTCTRGALQCRAGGVEATLAPGDGFLVPAGTPHSYAADGAAVAEAIFGVAPSYAKSG